MKLWPFYLEARGAPSLSMIYASPLIAIVLTLVSGALIFSLLGLSALAVLKVFLIDTLATKVAISELFLKATPIALCAIGLSLCYRANIWNIGAEGQLIIGGVCAGAVAITFQSSNWHPFWLISLALTAGVLGGMFWASITAFLRQRWHANEILVSLMLTYIAGFVLIYLVHAPLRDPAGLNFPQSVSIIPLYLLPKLIPQTRVNIGFAIMLLVAVGMSLFMFKTFAGYRLRVGGMAPLAAAYAGFSANKAIWTVLLISGALAGLAGAMEVLGPIGRLMPSISPGYGFAAIIVAFIGRLHPLGAVLGALIVSMLYLGGEMAQSRVGLPSAITGGFQGLLLFYLLACDVLIDYRLRLRA